MCIGKYGVICLVRSTLDYIAVDVSLMQLFESLNENGRHGREVGMAVLRL